MSPIRHKPVIALLCWGLAVAGAAQAAEVYQGNDVSYGKDSNTKLVVCDRESDDRGVHADGYSFSGNYVRVDDLDGAGGYCYQTNSISSGLGQHRTVEELNNWPDSKSGWSYH